MIRRALHWLDNVLMRWEDWRCLHWWRCRQSWEVLRGRETVKEKRLGTSLTNNCEWGRCIEEKLVKEIWRGRRLRDINVADYSNIMDAYDEPSMMALRTPARAIDRNNIEWMPEVCGSAELAWLLLNGYLVEES